MLLCIKNDEYGEARTYASFVIGEMQGTSVAGRPSLPQGMPKSLGLARKLTGRTKNPNRMCGRGTRTDETAAQDFNG